MKKIRDYYIPDTDTHFIKYLEKFEHYQEAQRNRALSYVKNWRLAIDIGANIGLWSKDLSSFFDRLVCFEPNEFCIDYLKKNIDLNKSTINSFALGSKNETKDLLIHSTNSGASSFINKTKTGYDYKSNPIYGEFSVETKALNVEVKKLDSFKYTNIDFIKIDVQGFELEVLEGAIKTLINNDPILCIEEDSPGDSKSLKFLEDYNYQVIDIINKEHILKKI
tara:strand:- start:116 stop:781 length:666 start_codon:yes stop_codon:yes gene_type:complete